MWVKFPRPAALNLAQRMLANVIDNKLIGTRLFGLQAKARQRRFKFFINPGRARFARAHDPVFIFFHIPFFMGMGRAHIIIAHHQRRQFLMINMASHQAHHAAHRMTDNGRL